MNPHYGWVPNPVRAGRIAGGSSGGSAAALAAGLADAALGTDSGGSIRIPAAFCGIVGFKPTFGLVSLEGCWPLAPSYDHAGPMARTVAGCVAMLEALVPEFEPAPAAGPRRPARRRGVDRRRRRRSSRARRGGGRALPAPRAHRVPARPRQPARCSCARSRRCTRRSSPSTPDAYGADVARKIRDCLEVTDAEVAEAERVRASYRDEAAALLDGFDLLLTPTQGFVAPTYEEAADDSLRAADHELHEPVQRARLAGAGAAVRDGRARAAGVDPARRPARLGRLRPRGRIALEAR